MSTTPAETGGNDPTPEQRADQRAREKRVDDHLTTHGFSPSNEKGYRISDGLAVRKTGGQNIKTGSWNADQSQYYVGRAEPPTPATKITPAAVAPKAALAAKELVHSGRKATSASNNLIKHFGAKRLRNYGRNPYSGSQSFDHIVPHAKAKELREHLYGAGWKHSTSPTYDSGDTWHTFKHDNGGHISVIQPKRVRAGSRGTLVRVYGDKRAKPTNLPYYD